MTSKIRLYTKEDHQACLDIIQSNTPLFFADDEVPLFEAWLNAQEEQSLAHPRSEKEHYFVIEDESRVVGCGGYLIVADSNEIFLAWGMVHASKQKKRLGKELLVFRLNHITTHYPSRKVVLATTQDIAPFFEKYGFKTTAIKPKFYSDKLDRYEMEKS